MALLMTLTVLSLLSFGLLKGETTQQGQLAAIQTVLAGLLPGCVWLI
jgi:hypothetical protein